MSNIPKFALGLANVIVLALAVIANAQSKPAAGQVPRGADGKPDFSGFWDNPKEPGSRGPATTFNKEKMAPFVPGGEALFYEPRTGDPRHDEPRAFCMPSGFPSAFLGPYPIQLIQTPQYLVMQTEFMNVTRIIPLDGRPHLPDNVRLWNGDSRGRWEGDTLVVDWRNFDPRQEYEGAHQANSHFVERFTRVDEHTIDYQVTVDDPTT